MNQQLLDNLSVIADELEESGQMEEAAAIRQLIYDQQHWRGWQSSHEICVKRMIADGTFQAVWGGSLEI